MRDLSYRDYLILNHIHESDEPIGSGELSRKLELSESSMSEATIGRRLRKLDHLGLTERKGYMGRVLTDTGNEALRDYKDHRKRQINANYFMRLTQAEAKNELLQILIARRAIERETCRLAAEKASTEDIAMLRGIIEKHQDYVSKSMSGADEDTAFHQEIARISGNKLLAAALDLIRQNRQATPVYQYIRERVGSSIPVDHSNILRAIISGDPEAAERAMTTHIDNVIADVNKYWDVVNRNKGKNPS